ncbi:putative response regulator receiver protein [Magnetofaba australis IT-1]|uniref:Putative response regulator receiver protein n=1 Tax=Magnetofaba australis IT-1 TaxID=1434232 RepID=A0A1Y2K499_9PROT|nr:putative response regulator receiver protein [Magnetofaba australis IT-1]
MTESRDLVAARKLARSEQAWRLGVVQYLPGDSECASLIEALGKRGVPVLALADSIEEGGQALKAFPEYVTDFFSADSADAMERLLLLADRLLWNQGMHALLVGPRGELRTRLNDMLRLRRFRIMEADDAQGMFGALQADVGVRLLIVQGMSEKEAAALVAQVRLQWTRNELVVLACVDSCASTACDEIGLLLVKSGADDLIRQPLGRTLFLRQIDRAMALFEYNQGYKRAATVDRVTGLVNRRGFLERGLALHANAKRGNLGLSTAMFRVEGFGRMRRLHAPMAAELLRKRLAQEMQRNFRNNDVVGQFGPDEFMVLMVGMKPDSAKTFFAAVKERLESIEATFQGRRIHARFHIGVCMELHDDLREMLVIAQEASHLAERKESPEAVIRGLNAAPVIESHHVTTGAS